MGRKDILSGGFLKMSINNHHFALESNEISQHLQIFKEVVDNSTNPLRQVTRMGVSAIGTMLLKNLPVTAVRI